MIVSDNNNVNSMRTHIAIHIIVLSCIFTTGTLRTNAQETKTIVVGDETISYTETYNDLSNTVSYYNNDLLVLSITDTDTNGSPDVWVLFSPDVTVRRELRDSTGDGAPDITFTFKEEEMFDSATGEGLQQFSVPTPKPQQEGSGTAETASDYAGDLEDIEKLAGEGGGVFRWVLVAILVILGTMWLRRRKKD